MCQLFAVSAAKPLKINPELERFLMNSRVHKHGWGYANFDGHNVYIKREAIPAYESGYAASLLAAPLSVQNAFFHIRYATVGSVDILNAHPLAAMDLMGRTWTVIHNGTIFDCPKLDGYYHSQSGDSDTERILLHLIWRINEKAMHSRVPLSDEQRFAIVNEVLTEIADGNKLNIILNDGDVFYVHGNSTSGSKALGEIARHDYIYSLKNEGATLLCTVPLDDKDWQPIPLNTVLAYRNGELVRSGQPHDFEYVESDEDMKYLYRGFAEL